MVSPGHAVRMKSRRRVGIVLFEGVTALDLVGPAEAFACARHSGSTEPAYEVLVLGVGPRVCVSESGVKLLADERLEDAPRLDTLIVPGGSGLRVPETNRLVSAFVKRRARHVRRLAAVCTGIYGVAPSGVLDCRRVTTHWAFADDVAQRFPKLELSANELFIKDGPCYTAAGVTSGIDLSLSLIEEDLGPAQALAVAREMVVYMQRPGGQEQFSEPLRFQLETRDRLRDLSDYVTTHLGRDLSVPALGKRLGFSPRQLSRLCRRELGQSPAALVQRLRLDAARQRLLERSANIDQISASVGFRSADAFRRAFEQRFGVAPSAYRERFRPTSVPRRAPKS